MIDIIKEIVKFFQYKGLKLGQKWLIFILTFIVLLIVNDFTGFTRKYFAKNKLEDLKLLEATNSNLIHQDTIRKQTDELDNILLHDQPQLLKLFAGYFADYSDRDTVTILKNTLIEKLLTEPSSKTSSEKAFKMAIPEINPTKIQKTKHDLLLELSAILPFYLSILLMVVGLIILLFDMEVETTEKIVTLILAIISFPIICLVGNFYQFFTTYIPLIGHNFWINCLINFLLPCFLILRLKD